MRKIFLLFTAIAIVGLGGCTAQDVATATATACKFQPDVAKIDVLIPKYTGAPPGVGIGIDVVNAISGDICAAYGQKKKAGPGGRAGIYVRGVNITGHSLP
jgi:hypothetical protein